VSNDPGQCNAVVNYTVTFGDNCPGATLAQTAGLASGSQFPLGNTVNSFTVTDASGNTATCSFTVRVVDTEAPTITCPSNITVSNDPGQCSAVVNYTVTFNDNCPGAILTQTSGRPSGSAFPVGLTRNDFTVTDGFGNTATCTFDVIVNDTEVPTITCPSNITVNTDPGQCNAVVNYTVTFSDNCPGAVLVQTSGLSSGSAFPTGTTTNVFRAVDASSNFALCSFDVTVNDLEAPVAVCQNITVSTGSSGVFTITGNDVNGGSTDNCGISSLAVNPSSFTCANHGPNPVVLTVTDLSGNTSTCNATVTINAITQPVITASGPTTFCNGGSVILDAGAGYATYLWSTGATTQTITVTTSGNYSVTVTNSNGCTASAGPMTVTVNANPTPTITGSGPLSFCSGTGVTLDAGAGYASYLWSTGETTQTIFVLLPGTYNVTVTDGNGCSGAATPVTVTVNPNPAPVIFNFGPTTFCQGGSVTLDAGGGYTSYLWSTGATTRTILVTTSGNYCVTVTNSFGCPGSACRTVTVNPLPTPTITPSGPTTFCQGGSVTLNAGSGYLLYSWSTGAITQSINVTTSGTYNVTVTDLNGCTGAGTPVTVTVNPRPTPVITPSGPTTFCAGGSVTLDAGAGYSSYAWSTGATTRTIAVGASGTYTVTVSNSFGCTGVASQAVTVNPLPTVNISATNNGNICFGDPVTLTATAGYTSYAWSGGGTTNVKIVTAPGTYTVTVTNQFGCTNTASRTVTAVTQCTVPTGLVANPVGLTTATLNWAATPCADDYRVQYRRLGTNPWTSITVPAPTTSLNIVGLLPGTTYEWRMRVQCTQGGPTNYTNIVTFTTQGLGLKMAGASGEAGVQAPLLYPNPNNGRFTLEYFAEMEVEVSVCVYDMYGKRVHCEQKLAAVEGNVWQMAFENLSKGMYFLKVEGVQQGQVETQSVRFLVE
jgi:large repetitive protein